MSVLRVMLCVAAQGCLKIVSIVTSGRRLHRAWIAATGYVTILRTSNLRSNISWRGLLDRWSILFVRLLSRRT